MESSTINRALSLRVPIRRITAALSAFFIIIALLGGISQALMFIDDTLPGVDTMHDLFWVNGDQDVWTWATSFSLLLCSILLTLHWLIARRHDRVAGRYWLGLAVLFLLLSIDDVAMVHERSERGLQWLPTSGVFYFKWTLLAIPFTAIVSLLYLRFVLRLPPWVRNQIFLAAALCVGGAIGLEMVSSSIAYHQGDGIMYRANTFIEECVEQAGVVVFANVLMYHLAGQAARFDVRLGGTEVVVEMASAQPRAALSRKRPRPSRSRLSADTAPSPEAPSHTAS